MAFNETSSEVSKTPETHKLEFDADKLIGSETKESKPEVHSNENLEPVDPDKLIGPAQRETTDTGPKQVEVEEPEAKGGAYRDVKKSSDGTVEEVHHMPAFQSYESNSELGLAFKDGPAIKMTKEDHQLTASWGRSLDAQNYREKQAEFIREGNFKEAMQMDIDDIHEKFGDRYDGAIGQVLTYAEEKGLI